MTPVDGNGAFIHPLACVDDGAVIGPRTRVWAFAHVGSGAVIGADCNICDHTFIETGVVIGDRVTVKCGVFLWHGLTVEDDVMIGPAAAFTNDRRPRSRNPNWECLTTTLRKGSSIGANATVLPGLEVGEWAMVAAGAIVTRSVGRHRLAVGSPAREVGWVCYCGAKADQAVLESATCRCGLNQREQMAPSGR